MDANPSISPRRWSKTRIALVVGAGVVLVAAGVFAYDLFAPKPTTRLDQDLMDSPDGAMMPDDGFVALKVGEFRGADSFHRVSGTVTVYRGPDGQFLRFEDYEATSGPDVYLYLSATADGEYGGGPRLKILIPGGAEDGQATVRGDFNVRLPAGFDAGRWSSAIVWCDQFGVKFGTAGLA